MGLCHKIEKGHTCRRRILFLSLVSALLSGCFLIPRQQ